MLGKLLEGRKTFIVACGMVVYAVVGWWLNYLTPQVAQHILMEAAALAGLRAAIAKK